MRKSTFNRRSRLSSSSWDRISKKVTNRKVPAASPCSTTDTTLPASVCVDSMPIPTTIPTGIIRLTVTPSLAASFMPSDALATLTPSATPASAKRQALEHGVSRQSQDQAGQPQRPRPRQVGGAEMSVIVSARALTAAISRRFPRRGNEGKVLKHVAKNTPPPKELHRDRDLLYLCALSWSDSNRRTGTSTPASIRPNNPSRPSSLATRISILQLKRYSIIKPNTSTLLLGLPCWLHWDKLFDEFGVLLLHLLSKLLTSAKNDSTGHHQPSDTLFTQRPRYKMNDGMTLLLRYVRLDQSRYISGSSGCSSGGSSGRHTSS
ncbi:hypothetical protein EYF80_024063 [Liparis tanakae]|uniref:Uncharacterized protein n=1 Tax=Liparis tanakae TaxID=230148 RepID=A0A4Z2HJL2_9TELE|nr:hypothetical protein EYF80_024063 [Liparis tanakae]